MTTAPASILIVEDDRTTRLLLNEILDGAGYETSTADNGSAALEAIAASPPALVLLDVWLPGMNGLDVMAKAKERGLSPKIVVMTSADTPQTVLRALKENAYQYVTKPVEPRRLLELIERALSSPAVPPITVVSARPNWGPEKKSRFPREMGMVGPHLCQLGGAGPRGADSPGIVSAFRCCFLTSFLTSA